MKWLNQIAPLMAALLGAWPISVLAGVCSYNDPISSFGAGYSNNKVSGLSSTACTAPATTPARLNDTSFGRSTITAPLTGDYKFLQKNTSSTGTPPTISILIDDQIEMKGFADPGIAVPAVGPGCDDAVAGGTGGIAAIERHLHRSWPLFGQTYYYGDYNASPPNDPTTVTSPTSPYKKWWPFDPTMSYTNAAYTASPTSAWTGNGTNGSTSGYYPTPLPFPGSAGTSACSSAGLTAAEATQCNACVAAKGYYLHDGATPGDMKESVFMGTILNDYPPSWVHGAWAYGFIENDTLADSVGNPLFKVMHETAQTQTASCGVASPSRLAGWVPSCPHVYPTYDWAFIQTDVKWGERQKKGEGQNQTWASYGGAGAGNTPAGDLLVAGSDVTWQLTHGCRNCQTGAVVYIGMGTPCGESRPASLPPQTMTPCTGDCAYVDTTCGCSPSGGNFLAEAAHYLYNTQGVRTYFIGMGAHPAAMRRAAAEGNGEYIPATDVQSFHDALLKVLTDIIKVATSSATSTVNAVQVNVAGQEELVPRFVASQDQALWEGHLFKYYLFSEFAGNCTKAGDTAPIPNPNHPICTATCVCPGGSCTGRWLVDETCTLITSDPTGFLYQATWNGTSLVPGTSSAVAVWDARSQLRLTNWWQRTVYTAIDTNGDGVIDYHDGDGTSPKGMFLITAGATAPNLDLSGGVSDAVADTLAPYMGLDGTTRCSDVSNWLATVGKTFPAGPPLRVCARVILNYMLGEDLTNTNLLDSSDPNYLIGNRIWMLGDIFHSSPQNIGAPVSEANCKYDPRRCVSTIFNVNSTNSLPDYQPLDVPSTVIDPVSGASVANTNNVDAYQAYYLNETFGNKRPQVMMYGANDGMVHAIQTGCFVGTDMVGGTPSPGYYEGPGNTGCVAGSKNNGSELWAFTPPDLLPKLAALLSATHTYFADNTPMVRDIYAPDPDGAVTPTKRYTTSSPLTMDFRRVAIFGEREGGTHWHGLDVTDPTSPQYRWMFPQPNTADELSMGFSFGDWVPAAPPIVPVRLAAPAVPGYPAYTDSVGARNFQEKWVVMLPGGYDPYGVAGKTVYMLDAYTGAKIFQTTNSGAVTQDFPFAALPAPVAWGTSVTLANGYNKGYFDTAVVGDLGGQIWTLRFNDVGQGFPAGIVNNWFLGRAFRQYAGDDSGAAAGEYRMQHRNPIFQMAAVTNTDQGYMRAFLGSGDRANMAESGLGKCSLYNPTACGKQECKVLMATNASIGAGNPSSAGWSSFKGDLAATYTSTSANSFTAGAAVCSPTSTVLNGCIDCTPGPKSFTLDAPPNEPQYSCANPGGAWSCGLRTISPIDPAERLQITPGPFSPDPNTDPGYNNRMVGVNIFDAQAIPRSFFTTAATAATYDGRALTESSSGITNLFPSGFSPTSSPSLAPSSSGSAQGYYFNYPSLDERTATNGVLLQSCLVWYSMQPGQGCMADADCPGSTCNTTTHECVVPSGCGASSSIIQARTAYLYQLNTNDGSTNCGLTSLNKIRSPAPVNAFIVPPPPPQPLISINAKGQVDYGVVTPVGQVAPPAASPTGSGLPFSFFYTLELPRELHQCRHPGTGPSGASPLACYP